jgi:iron complex outermembrane receptor protein
MTTNKATWLATTALIGSLLGAGSAWAQSTGSQQIEEIIVTAATGPKSVQGVIVAETAPKTRSTITNEFLQTQQTGQTVLQSLNVAVPGLNFTNNDPYGSSGGNIRLRGFDGQRVALTLDGIPLNDTGNYSVYTNQLFDPEIIAQTSVNQGTTDVDTPTASASGGTIAISTRRPSADPGLMFNTSLGSNDYKRVFAMIDSGAFGPWGTRLFVAGSYQNYEKWRGPGELTKQQFNARIFQPLGGDDFISVAAHWNRNRNNNYRSMTLADYKTFGRRFDFEESCPVAVGPTPGVAGSDAFCTNYFGRQVNPSNTGNIRGQSSFRILDKLRLTVDPSFQYTLADGGAQLNSFAATDVQRETDNRLRGRSAAAGVDLNGDGDLLDTARFFAASVTNTRRYGLNSSLIYDLNDDHRVRVSYTLDKGKHRQTGDYGYLDQFGNPLDVFGGKDGRGDKVLAADGSSIRARDRYSVARLDQFAAEYRGQFFEERLNVNLGIRLPRFRREVNQFCFTQDGTSTVRCTTEPSATTLPNGNVTFVGVGTPPTQYIPPFASTRKFNKTLPNVGLGFNLTDAVVLYGNYAKGISLPRTDNLYTVKRNADGTLSTPQAVPETTDAFDVGVRYNRGPIVAQAALWKMNFKNRIISAFDDQLNINIDRNVGDVKQWGFDGQIGVQPVRSLTLYANASYNHSALQNDVRTGAGATQFLPAKGKELPETPKWTFGGRTEWQPVDWFTIGFQAKYVGKRFSTDVNDESVPSYVVADMDLRFNLPAWRGMKNSFLQINATNLFDERYLGSISTRSNATTIAGVSPASAPTYQPGAPRTYQVSLHTEF